MNLAIPQIASNEPAYEFELFFDKYSCALYGVLIKMTGGDSEKADEILMNTFKSVYEVMGSIPENGSVFCWLLRLARKHNESLISSEKILEWVSGIKQCLTN